MTSSVLVETAEGVLTITWNDPERLNGLTGDMLDAASDAIEGAAEDVRVVVLTGAGRAFTTGARLDGTISGTEPMDVANRLIRAVTSSPLPVVAAVNGPAAGFGCSVALAADITVAKKSAYFLLPFTNIGLMPDGGATAVVAASVGRARANAMALLGERLPAPEAATSGLIHAAVSSVASRPGPRSRTARPSRPSTPRRSATWTRPWIVSATCRWHCSARQTSSRARPRSWRNAPPGS
jgi:enoyl-CoA hydratase